MAEKRYYWMKFQRDFFTSLRIKKLRRLAGGDTYTIIYLKLQLLSIVSEGYLQFKHVLDSFAEEMAEEIDEDVENVEITISYLLACGLMIQTEDTYFLPYAAENIGSECASAERVRNLRERQKALHCNKDVTKVLRDCNVEKEREIDKEKDKESKRAPKHKYGEYQHVLLTEEEYERLEKDLGKDKRDACIKFLDEYIEMKGYKAKSHNLCIRKWVLDAVKEREKKPNKKNQFNQMIEHGYDFDEIERMVLSQQ